MSAIENYVLRTELVLDTIFDILKYEPETLVSCTRVSNVWDGVLWSKKPEFMFHLVLPLVVKRLSREDVFSCRLACRNWKSAVDGLNDQIPPWNHHINASVVTIKFPDLPLRGWSWFGNDQRHNPHDFLNSVTTKSGSGGSVFPTRAVLFETTFATNSNTDSDEAINPDEVVERYGNNYFHVAESIRATNYFHEILRDFGSHISHLVYRVLLPCLQSNIKLDLSPKYLVKMLNFVPHLRSLTIADNGSRCTDYWNGPPPLLPNLTSLTLRFSWNKSVPVITHFLLTSYGSQLHTLECLDEDLFLPQTHDRISPFVFPNLKNLKLIASWEIVSRKYEHFVQNLSSSVMAPCLERLSVELFHPCPTNCPMLLNLTKGISGAFSSSLVELHVHVHDTRMRWGCAGMCTRWTMKDAAFGVNLPHLTTCRFNFPISPSVLCVLTKLASIQELHLTGEHEFNLSDEQVFQIWLKQPNLQRLFFGETVQTRHEAELLAAERDALPRLEIARAVPPTAVQKTIQDRDFLLAKLYTIEAQILELKERYKDALLRNLRNLRP